jgi:hypothetical protein
MRAAAAAGEYVKLTAAFSRFTFNGRLCDIDKCTGN